MNTAQGAPAPQLDESTFADQRRKPEWQMRWLIEEDGTVDLTRPPQPPRVVKLKAEARNVKIDLAKSAVVIVDMQNDFFRDDGWFGLLGVDLSPLYRAIDPINRLLPSMRAADVPIVWVNWGVRPDGFGLPPNVLHEGRSSANGLAMGDLHPTRHYNILARGTWGAAIIDELDVRDEDIRVDKVRLSGFWDTELDGVLRHMGITTLIFAGVNLDRCVMATLEDAAFLGYDCLVVDDCTSSVHPHFGTEHCHLMIKQLLGFITKSDELITQIEKVDPGS
jgi:nicotinamidase-related amidase